MSDPHVGNTQTVEASPPPRRQAVSDSGHTPPSRRPFRFPRFFLSLSTFFLLIECVTGVLLMFVYAPSASTAWGSVWYIQTQAPAGWFIRGLHHFAADAMIVSLVMFVAALLIGRAYQDRRAWPRWWAALLLVSLALAASLSGHLLPWDQQGFWGTTVRVNILAKTPWIGDTLRRWLIGGDELGQFTLTRFHTLHVIVIPLLTAGLALFAIRRECFGDRIAGDAVGPRAPSLPWRRMDSLRPERLVSTVAFFLLAAFVWYVCGRRGVALLDAPADPTTSDYPARPEWHTLFLFQWLKAFSGPTAETIGAIIVPGLVALAFLAIPALPRLIGAGAAHRIVSVMGGGLLLVVAGLTTAAWRADANPSPEAVLAVREKQQTGQALTQAEQAMLRAAEFNRKRQRARVVAERALVLADEHGVPPAGPLELLRNDPLVRGPELFAANCATCHRYDGHDGLGNVPADPAASSDLFNFASRDWVRGLLENPMADRYFGRMKKPDGEPAHTRMSRFTSEQLETYPDEKSRRELFANYDAVAAYLQDESLHPGRFAQTADGASAPLQEAEAATASPAMAAIRAGRNFFMDVCNECHSYNGERSGTFSAPEMAGYGSVSWIEAMIADPAADSRYRNRGREPAQMPPFQDRLTPTERRLIAEWLQKTRDLEGS